MIALLFEPVDVGESVHAADRKCPCRQAISKADEIISRTSFLFIDNQYVEVEAGRLPVLSPVDGKSFASIAHASARDVDRAVQSARRCFDKDGWPQQDVEARAEILKKIAASLRTPEVCDALCVIESRDCGKPFSESQGDLGVCADTFDYYAEAMTPPALGHVVSRCVNASGYGKSPWVSSGQWPRILPSNGLCLVDAVVAEVHHSLEFSAHAGGWELMN
eukprot:Skav222908  [mRNA]  locus=scaffold1489:170516:175504:+ [translate_table: standard]